MADFEDELAISDEVDTAPVVEEAHQKESLNKEQKSTHKITTRGRTHKAGTGGIQVDLSKVKTKTTTHSKPSLPTPLTQYGFDEKKQARAKARAERESKEKKRKRSSTFYSDDERDKEKERQKDEKYMQVLEDLKKLRDYYHQEYKDMLDTKVQKQRKEIRNKTEALQKKQQEQEDRVREASHKVKRRYEHHKLQSDDNYLKNVTKSDVYLILGLQEKMIKEGKLKCQDDFDHFWMEMRRPDIFFCHFPDGLVATSGIHHKIVANRESPQDDNLPRSLSQIVESKESSRPTTRDKWAVTQRYHHIHSQQGELSPHKRGSVSLSKQVGLELERRFPQLEMPPLHCFTMDLGEKPPDPEEIRLKMELKMREKQRRKFSKKLHKMHQLAMANSAAATRILDRHTDLAFLMEGPELTDLISEYYWDDSPPVQHPQSSPPYGRLPTLSVRTEPPKGAPVDEGSLEKISSRPRPSSESPKTKRERDSDHQLVVYEPPQPLPLTMEEVRNKNRVIEAKILSSYWSNYMQTGKSIFLTSSS